ncbi:hypothetical protein ACFCZ3_11880 [Cellulosimicrobium cellulans]|uniref:hypothetical protein n=1 Tax=Cellulosimicrobium cellulans TaxID=1710 RepID=UPI0035D5E592
MSTRKKTSREEAERRAVQPLVWLTKLRDHRVPSKSPTVLGAAAVLVTYADSAVPGRPIWPGNKTIDERMGLTTGGRGKSAEASIRKLRDWGFLVVVDRRDYPDVPALQLVDARKLVYVLTTP